ncbi:MAG TPA: enoyl-CoA hydratase/isomerase family protein [Acidimicrobiia bacterium]|nr:enoyl-CoA hydratase/isomerase family protein [Acidimicrobiia bacterium]
MFSTRDDGPVRWLTISNLGRRNAVPMGSWRDLAAVFDDFEASSARVLVITGDGEDFCSGADLSDMGGTPSTTGAYDALTDVGAAASALHRLTKPTVAAVDGYAVGAGMNLALGCDIVIATERARFAEVFVKRGLTLDFGGTWVLPRLVGLARAKELALTGRMVGAAEALAMGMVARVVAPSDLSGSAASLAGELAAGAPLAQRFIKAGLDTAAGMSFDDGLAYEQTAQSLLFGTADVVEGMVSFLEKRPPEFEGR